MKYLRLFLCFLLVAALQTAQAAAGDDARVTQQVHDFFQWYCHLLEYGKDTNIAKQHRKEMSRYVTSGLQAKLVRKPKDSQEGDYFAGGLDSDPEWEKNITVSNVKAGRRNGFTAEVMLTGKEAGNVHARVTLFLEGGAYKIDSVEDIPDFVAMESAQLKMFYEQHVRDLIHAIPGATPAPVPFAEEVVTADCRKKAVAANADPKFDYFAQSEGFDPAWEQHVEIKNATVTPDGLQGTAEVLLTGGTVPDTHVKVALKHEGNTFKVDGVEKVKD